ncbi:MAG: chemotaxis response regulator protein-glutamate methylesterase [Burkholderiales bacterium]
MSDLENKITVLVVDDSTIMRRILATALGKDPDISVIGFASNGAEAIQAVKELSPQAVTLDVEMPVMDGISALKEIRKFAPRLPVIMFSTLTQAGARAAIDALMNGASDYVGKPAVSLGMAEAFNVLSQTLIPKIKGLVRRSLAAPRQAIGSGESPPPQRIDQAAPKLAGKVSLSAIQLPRTDAVCIGVSTGGPEALVRLFEGFNKPVSFPIFIVQHMPAMFTTILAQRLNALGKLPVVEATDGQEVFGGHVYLAPGGLHMNLRKSPLGRTFISLNDAPAENSCKPAVDVLFRAAASVYGANCLAVVLTGMGYDGLKGAREIKSLGGSVYAQDQESSVVWGMPGAIVEAGIQNKILPLAHMASEILRRSSPTASVK